MNLFREGVLENVHSLGGDFTTARITTLEVVSSLEGVPKPLSGQVLYLPKILGESYACTFEVVPDHRTIPEIIAALPLVAGVVWCLGNGPTIEAICQHHLSETGEKLLQDCLTWTADEQTFDGGRTVLVVGHYDPPILRGLSFYPTMWGSNVGILLIGVPAQE